MHELSVPSAPPLDHPLWSKISCYSIGPADAAFGFAQRLARENGWTVAYANRVIEEYRRFCFLTVTAGQEVTPSDAVDQAWHLHLTYTRDYWARFCPDVLGCALHHGPTAGGDAERHRFFDQYAATLKAYEAVFGLPPADIWPGAQRRLVEDPKAWRVSPRDYLIISRTSLRRWSLFALAGLTAAILFWWRS